MFGMLAGLASSAMGWLGSAAGALTSAVKALAGNKVVQKAAGAALSAIAKPSKPESKPSAKPATKSVPIKAEEKKDNAMLYIMVAGVAVVALIMLMKR